VVSARALEVGAGVAVNEGLFADNHGVDQGGLARWPEFMHFGDDCAVQVVAPGSDAVAGEAGETFDILYFGGGQRGDAMVGEIALVVEGTGIAKIARQLEFGGNADAVAVMQDRQGGGAGRIRFGGFFGSRIIRARAINAEADAGVYGCALARLGLHLFGFEVDGLFDFVEAALLQVAVTQDVGGDQEFLAIGVRLNAGVEARGSSARLHVKRTGEEKSPESQRPAQPRASVREVSRGGRERRAG